MTESWKIFWQSTADNCNCQNYILKQFFFFQLPELTIVAAIVM